MDRASDSTMARPKAILVGSDRSCLVHKGSTDDLLLQISSGVVLQSRDLRLSCNTLYLLSPCICFVIVLNCDLFNYRDDSLVGWLIDS